MAKFFMERYPSLRSPHGPAAEADELLDELHTLDYYTLSFSGIPVLEADTIRSVKERLAKPISKRYEEALTFKLNL